MSIVWIAMLATVNPVGDFPLNDDWIWGESVRTLYERHVLRISHLAEPTVVAQILWGYLACLPCGFSYTALRLATALLGLSVVLATYTLARAAGATKGLAFLCAFAVAANPLIFESSVTFMTEIPFLAFFLLSLVCFVRAAGSRSLTAAALAITLALAATLTRQIGIMIPIVFAGGCVLSRMLTMRTIGLAVISMLVVRFGLHEFTEWLQRTGQGGIQGQTITIVLAQLWHPFDIHTSALTVGDGFRITFTYVGFFILPALIALVPRRLNTAKAYVLLGLLPAAAVGWTARTHLERQGWTMPFNWAFNLVDIGLGPTTLSDVYVKKLDHLPRAGMEFWHRVTALGLVGGAVTLWLGAVTGFELLSRKLGRTARTGKLVAGMALAFVAAYGAVLLLLPFDRYFIPLFPMILLAGVWGSDTPLRSSIARALSRLFSTAAVLAVVIQAAFSVAATHDYLAWNRARWRALHDLMEVDHVTAYEIDGGYEFNGLYRSGAPADPYNRDERYMVALGSVPGYQTLHTYPYPRWIGPSPGTIVVLAKEESPP